MNIDIPSFDQHGPSGHDRASDPTGYLLGLKLAPWWRRTVASAIDGSVLLGYLVLNDWVRPTWWGFAVGWFFVAAVVAEFSPGKGITRLSMAVPVMDREKGATLASATYGLVYGRMMLKVFDIFCFGWARPLWHPRRQTWADSWTGVVFFVNERGPWMEGFIRLDPDARGRRLV